MLQRLPIRWVILGATLTALGLSLIIWSLGAAWLGRTFFWYSQEWRMIAQIRMIWPENDRLKGLTADHTFPANAQQVARQLSVGGCFARIFDGKGNLIAQGEQTSPVPSPSPRHFEEISRPWDEDRHRHSVYAIDFKSGRDWMVIMLPISRDGKDVGMLQFCSPRREPREIKQLTITYLALAAFAATLACVFSAFAISHWLAGPIRRLHQTTLRLRKGDLSARTGVTVAAQSRNELEQVSEAFDQMAGSLEQTLIGQRRFIADASHELKTPLTAIGGMADMLKLTQDPQKQQKAIQIINQECDRMSRLVADLLTLSKSEQAPQGPDPVSINLCHLLRETVEVVQAAHPDRHIEVQASDELLITGNPDELQRAVRNLVDNAIQHTPPEAVVRTRCQQKGRELHLEIQDSGPGIDPKDLPHLFERFYRPDSSRARKTGGSGLGLAIVRSIVQRHGGKVEVESELGKGTTFRIVFGGRA